MAEAATSVELTPRGRVVAWLGALAAGAAWLAEDPNARLAAAMLLAPLLVDWALRARRLHEVGIRVLPRRTVAGAPFQETLTVTASGARPLRECLLLEPRTMRSEPPALLPTLRPGAATGAVVRMRSLQRSHVLERVFVLTSAWPLGLWRTRAVVKVAADLVTEPARVPLDPRLLAALHERELAPRDRHDPHGAEFHSLREHLPDEDARFVHARRSAALGTLVRRLVNGRAPHTVGVVLDLRRPPGRPLQHGQRRFEWSLGAAAALVAALRQHAAELLVMVLDADPVRCAIRGAADERAFATLLAEAQPTPHRPLPADWADALRRCEHCFWIPAGGYHGAAELDPLAARTTVIGGPP